MGSTLEYRWTSLMRLENPNASAKDGDSRSGANHCEHPTLLPHAYNHDQ